MANAPVYRHIVLTGSPGVGKTTLIKKTCDALKTRNVPVQGFYTQECREGSNRIGFDVVTLNGDRQPLARLPSHMTERAVATCSVGKYRVLTSSFEACALPTLTVPSGAGRLPVIVVDEIGKMELFSRTFEQVVRDLMSCSNLTLLATIPEKRRVPVAFADEIRRSPSVHLFEINTENRKYIGDGIVDAVVKSYEAQQ